MTFDEPCNMAVAANDDIFVSDGLKLLKFSANLEFCENFQSKDFQWHVLHSRRNRKRYRFIDYGMIQNYI